MALLITIPGVSTRSAEMILAENGADMTRFPSAAHLASWAGNHASAGKNTSGESRPGDPWLKNALGLAATAAARSKNTYLASRYKRIAIRRGKKRALVAIGHTILTSIWHMLTNNTEYADLGADYFLPPTGRARQTRRLVSDVRTPLPTTGRSSRSRTTSSAWTASTPTGATRFAWPVP